MAIGAGLSMRPVRIVMTCLPHRERFATPASIFCRADDAAPRARLGPHDGKHANGLSYSSERRVRRNEEVAVAAEQAMAEAIALRARVGATYGTVVRFAGRASAWLGRHSPTLNAHRRAVILTTQGKKQVAF